MFYRISKSFFAFGVLMFCTLTLYMYFYLCSKDFLFAKNLNSDVKHFKDRIEIINNNNIKQINNHLSGFQSFPKAKDELQKKSFFVKDEIKLKGNKVEQAYIALHKDFKIKNVLRADTSNSSIQTLDIYKILPFDNIDGGVWKQGWEITYDNDTIKENRLEVFIVPHSHNDPGWLKTFEEYFFKDTKKILDNMYKQLSSKSDLKFIYAEMSFFELWWSGLDNNVREIVKKLAHDGQLEIVTGGWVMTDEANTNYFASIMELIEGHEFLQNQLGITPKNHWAIDPFGHSPTISYLLNRSGLSNIIINRVHYSVKKYLAKKKDLEFKWRQQFAGSQNHTDILTHMFPFFSYDVPHTCGPDPKICCQFDFQRMYAFNCPWGKNPKPITDNNLVERALALADQYRKKAQLFRMNTLLIPLGDDFRYNTENEWADQYTNYKRLMNYMNKIPELNIHAQFGTLEDYFAKLRERLLQNQDKPNSNLSVLSGDFFTYADRDDNYWSGYFTSRPFYKHMDRTLQHYLRSADLLFTLASAQSDIIYKQFYGLNFYNNLVESRRALSLFQHHDGVTGTAKQYVVKDYGQKMLNAINNCKTIISNATSFLLNVPFSEELKIDEEHFINALPKKNVLKNGSSLILFNSLAHFRNEVICIHVDSLMSRIKSENDKKFESNVFQQIGPILYVNYDSDKIEASTNKFELCFMANLPALGFVKYNIFQSDDLSQKVEIQASGNFLAELFNVKPIKKTKDSEVYLSNKNLKSNFDVKTGFLKSVVLANNEFPVQMSFVKYDARLQKPGKQGDSVSGAYLFLPDGPAVTLPSQNNDYVVVKGNICQYVYVKGPIKFGLQQVIKLNINAQSLLITNFVNLGIRKNAAVGNSDPYSLQNIELAMRISTKISKNFATENDEYFFTDLNNFQMIRRQNFKKLPLQANFYPMSGAAYLEDSYRRLTFLGRQALGVSNLEAGQIEFMLDRRLINDDNRGLGEGVLDNQETMSQFHLFVEEFKSIKSANIKSPQSIYTTGYLSLQAHKLQLSQHYPLMVLASLNDWSFSENSKALKKSEIDDTVFSCDLHLVALRTLSLPTVYLLNNKNSFQQISRSTKPDRSAAFILHRFAVDKRFLITNEKLSDNICPDIVGQVDLKTVFKNFNIKSAINSSLTLLYKSKKALKNFIQKLEPMELRTIKINY